MKEEFGRLSSTFYKLERPFGDDSGYLVYEFHTVVNGNMYIKQLEEDVDHHWRNSIREIRLGRSSDAKQAGNAMYEKLLAEGFRFAGKYKMDIFGVKEAV